MRWLAHAVVLAAVLVVLAASSCTSSSTGKACSSIQGTCLYSPSAAACGTQAPSSAQDCSTAPNQGGWVCCLLPVETDAAADGEASTTQADATLDATGTGVGSDGSSESAASDEDDSARDASSTSDASTDGPTLTEAGDAASLADAAPADEDASEQ
jgi:hypothetical protein